MTQRSPSIFGQQIGNFFKMVLDKKQISTTLPRVVVIAGLTILVSSVVTYIVFLTPGTQASFLPPWQLLVAEASSIAILLFLSLGISKSMSGPSVLSAALIVSIALTGLIAYFWSVGHTWSMPSAIGKTIAAFLTLSYPILLSTIVILMMRRRSANSTTIVAVAFGLCLFLTVPMVLVGITLACGLAGDCL